MYYYPVNLNLKDRLVLIFGSGTIALRKASKFNDTGAKIIMISKTYSKDIKNDYLFINKKVRQDFLHKDLAEIVNDLTLRKISIVITATNDSSLNHDICNWFKDRNILTNNVSDYTDSDFINPGVIRKGSITLTASTNGNSPGVTRMIKAELEDAISEEMCRKVNVIGEIREVIRTSIDDEKKRKAIMDELIKLDLDQLIARRQTFED